MFHSKQTVTDPTRDICERIWLAIVERRLRPGTRLKEEQVAEIFSVSRARVRQALSALESAGLVKIIPNRGAFIAEPSVEEARDVFHIRKMIEARVLERLIDRTPADAIARLESHLAEERTATAHHAAADIIRLSGGFHLLLAELAGSEFLFTVLRDLVSRSSLITAMYRARDLHNCGPDEHQALVDLIRSGDTAMALTTMQNHLQHVENELDLTEDLATSTDLRQILL